MKLPKPNLNAILDKLVWLILLGLLTNAQRGCAYMHDQWKTVRATSSYLATHDCPTVEEMEKLRSLLELPPTSLTDDRSHTWE